MSTHSVIVKNAAKSLSRLLNDAADNGEGVKRLGAPYPGARAFKVDEQEMSTEKLGLYVARLEDAVGRNLASKHSDELRF